MLIVCSATFPDNSCFLLLLLAEPQCRTTAKADIVLLVDGSWSIGRLNFKTVRNFIGRMVGVFDIGPERVQIGKQEIIYYSNALNKPKLVFLFIHCRKMVYIFLFSLCLC